MKSYFSHRQTTEKSGSVCAALHRRMARQASLLTPVNCSVHFVFAFKVDLTLFGTLLLWSWLKNWPDDGSVQRRSATESVYQRRPCRRATLRRHLVGEELNENGRRNSRRGIGRADKQTNERTNGECRSQAYLRPSSCVSLAACQGRLARGEDAQSQRGKIQSVDEEIREKKTTTAATATRSGRVATRRRARFTYQGGPRRIMLNLLIKLLLSNSLNGLLLLGKFTRRCVARD